MIYIIINPTSGNGRAQKYIPRIKEYLNEQNVAYQLYLTEYKGHASRLAQTIKNKGDTSLVIAVGGDGTLNEVINGIFPSQIPVGYIPSGSGNDFAREAEIPLDPIAALQKIMGKKEQSIDIGRINGRYFINAAGIGFDGKVTELANRSRLKKRMGKFVYIFAVLKALFVFKPTNIKIDVNGKTYSHNRVWLVAVSNGRYFGGGMKISPNASNNDGEFDVCIIKGLNVLQLLRYFPTIFSGRHIYLPYVELLKGNNIRISSEEILPIQIDGEVPDVREKTLEFQMFEKSVKILS